MPSPTDTTEGVIRVMPEALANKIAAGEVVQRPASVAKELIENALDAGATEVQLVIKQAGRALVQVIDDGCGMSRSDAATCFQRHATSKIRSVDDLERLQTLGFRGEALASIGAVAQVELRTRRVEDAAGTLVRVEGSEAVTVEPCAAPGGTSVAVRNLFFNVPVRRNFLKTPATEFKHLTETFQQLALSNPEVAFTLVHDGREVYRLGRQEDGFAEALRARVGDLFGRDRMEALVPVEDETSYVQVRGFVGAPEQHRRIRGEQFLFVNGRYVSSNYLAHAVRTAYGALLPEDTFPFFALFLQIDPRHVDVNVHPTKAEVKFDDQSGVYGFLRSATRAALGAHDLVPQLDREDDGPGAAARPSAFRLSDGSGRTAALRPFAPTSDDDPALGGSAAGSGERPSARHSSERGQPRRGEALGDLSARLYDATDAQSGLGLDPAPSPRRSVRAATGEESPGDAEGKHGADARPRPVWQVQRRFLVTPTEDGLLVVDQHAAHKRVLYERALRRLDRRSGTTQQLLFPETVQLSAADAALLEEVADDLDALGFDLDAYSGRTVAVRGVPAELARDAAASLLEDLLAEVRTRDEERGGAGRAERLARGLAGRGAVRAGQTLGPEERRALVADLFRCEMPYADPQGRPTTCVVTVEELADRFEG